MARLWPRSSSALLHAPQLLNWGRARLLLALALFAMVFGVSSLRSLGGRSLVWAQQGKGSKAMQQSRKAMTSLAATPEALVQEAIKANHVMVFSKTYCPYCTRAKEALTKLSAKGMQVYELDERKDGEQLQAALLALTGQRTVPNVFIGGQHIGGCDKTLEKIADGSLQKLLLP